MCLLSVCQDSRRHRTTTGLARDSFFTCVLPGLQPLIELFLASYVWPTLFCSLEIAFEITFSLEQERGRGYRLRSRTLSVPYRYRVAALSCLSHSLSLSAPLHLQPGKHAPNAREQPQRHDQVPKWYSNIPSPLRIWKPLLCCLLDHVFGLPAMR